MERTKTAAKTGNLRGRALPGVVGLALLAGVLACGVPGFSTAPQPTPTATAPPATLAPTPEPRAATLRSLTGTVETRSLGGDFAPAAQGQALHPGDEIRTGADGEAILELDDGTVVRVAPDSRFQLTLLEGTGEQPVTRFFLNVGQAFSIHEGELPSGARYEVETLSGVASIRGSLMGVGYQPSLGTEVTCLLGSCSAQVGEQEVPLTDDQATTISLEGLIAEPVPMSATQNSAWAETLNAVQDAGLPLDETLQDLQDVGRPLDELSGAAPGLDAFGDAGPTAEDLTTLGAPCNCVGTEIVCEYEGQTFSYPDHPFCGGSQGQCVCVEGTLVCADGTFVEGGC